MLSLRSLVLCASLTLLLAAESAAQIVTNRSVEVNLSATQVQTALVEPNTPSVLLPFQVAVEGRDAEGFDVASASAGLVVTLILPDGTEVSASNAAAHGIEFAVLPEDSEPVTSRLLINFFSVAGTHTFIRLPPTAPAGVYQIKLNSTGVATETPVYASYLSGSPVRLGVVTSASSYRVGDTVVISAFLFSGETPLTGATVNAAVLNTEQPAATPAQVVLQDGGPQDAAVGDGIFTGVYTVPAAGKYAVSVRASGTSPTGADYKRTSSSSFRALPPLVNFVSFADAGVDDNGNNLFDRLVVTANVNAQLAGSYRFEVSLVGAGGAEVRASQTVTLALGAQGVPASFTSRQVKSLGGDGPYAIRKATLVQLSDPEEPTAAFVEDAGVTGPYTRSQFERPGIEFTGNNTVTGVDTNNNGKFDILRIQAEVDLLQGGGYDWSGSLRDSSGQEIQAVDGAGSLAAGLNQITFEYSGVRIAQHGKDGPYALRSVLLFNGDISVSIEELLRTQAFPVTAFECSDAVSPPVQSVALTPATVVGGNATTLRVTLAQPAPACGAKVIVNATPAALIAAALPADVIVPAGETATDVTIITTGVAASTPVQVTATAGGASQSAALTVNPSAVAEVSFTEPGIVAGGSTWAKVRLDGAAPTGGLTVALASSDPSVAYPTTQSATVRNSDREATFIVSSNSAFQSFTTVQISASANGVTKSAGLTVFSEVNIPGSISPGGPPVTVTATQPGHNFMLAFEGTAGQRVSAKVADVNLGSSSCCSVQVSLKKPDGTPLGPVANAGTGGGFLDTQTLTVTGTHYVFVDPQAANTGSVTVTLYDVPPDVSVPVVPGGAAVSVATTVPGQNARLTFDGAAGQRVSLLVSGVTADNSALSVHNPDGSALVSYSHLGSSNVFTGALTLPAAGVYTILLDPKSFTVGGATFTLYDVPADVSGAITPGGPPVTVTTTAPGQKASLGFAGAAGQRVSLRITGVTLAGGNGRVDVFLKKPDGTTLASATSVSSGGDYIDVQTLPAAGAYTVFVSPQGSVTGSVTLTLYDVPPDAAANITSGGGPVTLTTTVPGQNAVASFNGTAGQRVTANIGNSLTGGNGYADVFLRKPDGTTLASATFVGSGGGFINTQTLPAAGVYTLYVNPQSFNTGGVTLTLNDVSADVTAVVGVGGPSVTVTTTSAGQNARLTFDAAAGQRVSINTATTFGGCWHLYVYKPDGSLLTGGNNCGSGSFIDPLTMPVSGTYTILIDPSGASVGSATVTLYDVVDLTGSATVGGPAVPTTITTPGQVSRLTFEAEAGQRVSVNVTTNFPGCWTLWLYKPDGTALTGGNNCGSGSFIDPLTVPATGTYMVRIDPSGAGIGTANVRVYEVVDLTGTAEVGGPAVSTTIGTPGQVSRITFEGAAGQRVSVNSTSNFTGCWHLGLYKPDGSQLTNVFNCGSSTFIEPLILPAAGTYTVRVDPSGTGTGTANIRVYEVIDQTGTAEVGGPAVSKTIGTPGQVARLTFEGTAGQRVSVNSTTTFAGCWNLGVYKPDGSQLSNTFNCGNTFVEPQSLPVSGTYTVLIDPSGAGTGTTSVRLYEVVDLTGTLVVNDPAVGLTTNAPGQNARLTFAGTAGQQVTVRVTGSTYSCVRVTLLKPDNTSMTNVFSCGSSFNLSAQTLPTTGTYAVTVDPNSASIGSISVRVTSP